LPYWKAYEEQAKAVLSLYASPISVSNTAKAEGALEATVRKFMPLAQVAFLWPSDGSKGDEVSRYREAYHAVLAALSPIPARDTARAELLAERDSLADIVATGIDEVAGAALDDAEETIAALQAQIEALKEENTNLWTALDRQQSIIDVLTEAPAPVARAEGEETRLRRMVERRDEFIIGKGLWDQFKEACHEAE
jgi:hypothetical protein